MDDGYVSVCSVGSAEINQLPLNPDGSLSLEMLKAVYPRASGLFFMEKTDSSSKQRTSSTIRRIVLINNGHLFPPSRGWGEVVYNVLSSDGDSTLPPSPQKTWQTTEEQPRKKAKTESPKREKEKKKAYAPEGDESSETVNLRLQGNDSYRRSFEDQTHGMKERHLRSACNLYRQSAECAQFADQECAALKNLGKASWRLASTYMESEPAVHPSAVSGVFSEAIRALTKALQLGTEIKKPSDWLVDVDSSVERCVENVKEFLIHSVNVFGARCRYLLDLLTENCHSLVWKGRLYVELARTHFKSAIVSMTEGDECGFAPALHQLRECHFPIEEARRLLELETDLDELEQVELDVMTNMSAAEALQTMHGADLMLEQLLCEEEELNMDGIYVVMDKYRQAVVLTRLNHVEYEAMAHSKLGKLYIDVLKLEKRGKEYLTQSIQLANTMSPRNFAGEDWFDAATDALRGMQEAEKRREDEKWRKQREPYIKKLSKELEDLEKMSEQSAESVIKMLPTKFPAKHRKKSEMLNLKEDEDLSKKERGEIKKLLQKLILLYHPDHVDKKAHGLKYYVLCEEITKVLTAKYECFKG